MIAQTLKYITLSILCCLVVSNVVAGEKEGSTMIYDIYGRYLGSTRLLPAPGKLTARLLQQMMITTADGHQATLATGVYFLVSSSHSNRTIPFSHEGTFSFRDVTSTTLPIEQSKPSDIEVADVTGDGRDDIIFSIYSTLCNDTADARPRLWVQTAQGNFVDETASRIPPGLHSAQDVEVFDCDGDGDLDIFLGGYGCGNPYPAANLLINDGTGFFTDQSNLRLPNVSSQTFVSFAKSARLDTGNSNDIAVILFGVIDPQDSIQRRFSKPEIWLNNGAGYFRRDSLGRMPDTAKYGFFDLFISDLNKDTLSDIVFSNFYTLITRPSDPTPVDSLSGQTAFFRNEGNGYFVDETMTHMPEGFHRMTRDLAFADIDGDGDLDILEVGLSFSLQSPLVRLFLNDGTGRFSISSNSGFENLAGHFNGAKFGLLNNDNLPDLFMTKVFPGVPDYDVLMINKGDGSFADSSSLLPQIQDFSVACALFDHERDHDLDIVIANSGPRADTTGQNVLYHNLLYDITDGIGDDPTVAGVFSLSQNYPNPFNPSTSISYTLAKGGNVRLSVYNLMGQLIGVLIDGVQEAGSHSTLWRPDHVSTGIYFYQISVDGRVLDRKKAIYVR